MSEFEFYLTVLKTLEEIGANYMVVGAYGASAYGLSRSTHDVDVIVDLDEAACDLLASCFRLVTTPTLTRCATQFVWALCLTSSTARWG